MYLVKLARYLTWSHHRLSALLYFYMRACKCHLFTDEGSRGLLKRLNCCFSVLASATNRSIWSKTPDVFPKIVFGCRESLSVRILTDWNYRLWCHIEQQIQILLMQLKTSWAHQKGFTHLWEFLKWQGWPSSSTIVLWFIFIYRSELHIDSHGWPRKRPCMVAKQADKPWAKKTWSSNPSLLQNCSVSYTNPSLHSQMELTETAPIAYIRRSTASYMASI